MFLGAPRFGTPVGRHATGRSSGVGQDPSQSQYVCLECTIGTQGSLYYVGWIFQWNRQGIHTIRKHLDSSTPEYTLQCKWCCNHHSGLAIEYMASFGPKSRWFGGMLVQETTISPNTTPRNLRRHLGQYCHFVPLSRWPWAGQSVAHSIGHPVSMFGHLQTTIDALPSSIFDH